MELNALYLNVLRLIYPLPEKTLKRDRPLEVLAVGLSRCGTESLRRALIQLEYADCHHGFRFVSDPSEAIPLARLTLSQRTGSKNELTALDFDQILGDCAAVTDAPFFGFAHELIDAYPDAKVIVNYREDVEACLQSVETTVDRYNDLSWWNWVLTFFHPVLFWSHHVNFYLHFQRHYNYDLQKYGRRWYREHYRGLEDRLEETKYLKWKVQDGWQPLCDFLGKPVPTSPFPSGNTPKEF